MGNFKIEDDQVFEILFNMLSHSKTRPTAGEIEIEFERRYSIYII